MSDKIAQGDINYKITPGDPTRLGAIPTATGLLVAVASEHASRIEFCLFDASGDIELARLPLLHRAGPIFHAHIEAITPGIRYGLRAHGPWDPAHGQLFNPAKLLIEPYAIALDRAPRYHETQRADQPDGTRDPRDSAPFVPKAIVTAPPAESLALPLHPLSATILYELHIRGFTKRHPVIPESQRGTFAAVAHPAVLGHLRNVGVTTVELMPAMATIEERHLAALHLPNYWGYNPVAFLAPDPRLAPGGWSEIRATTDTLRAAGIETILDVVLNHTGEGDLEGPSISLRGLDNSSYFRLHGDGTPFNDTGCGNTLALDHPLMLRLAMDALRAWALWGGVQGFRFDLATTLARRADGFDPRAPFLQALAQDPVLSRLKLIAEPWDIGPGGWQTGHFPPPFAEWNDRYRDHARRFWRGDAGMLGNLATRLAGSADLFRGRSVAQSINFITAHDGFTLADLVSYERKHNEANGEQNRDGTDDNLSWNNGTEGETTDPVILAARKRDQAALLATLLLSRGTPMLSQGAELGASQGGNNNAYPQDNEITWLDWAHADADLIALTSRLSHFRAAHPWAWQGSELHGDGALYPEVSWCGADGNPLSDAGWNDAAADLLIMVRTQQTGEERIALIFHRGLSFRLVTLPPARPGRGWKLAVSTAEGSDIKSNRVSCPARAVIALVEHASSRRDQAPDDGFLARVAAAADIGTEWWEVNGTHHRVCAATHRTLLEGMGFPASTRSDAEASLHRLSAARPLPVSFAARVGRRAQFPLALSQGADPSPLCLSLSNEAGRTTPLAILPNNGTITECTAPDGTRHRQWRIDLPALPPGRYRLEHESTACALTIAPETCYQPLTNRVIGLTAQLYSLRRPGDQGIGDFTSLAQAAGFAARNGAAILGINPLHARFLNQPDRASPYHPSDRRFLDPMMIDLAAPDPGLDCEQVRALLAQHAPQIAALEAAPMIDHARVATLKTKVLRAARRSSSAFAAFTSQALSALRDFAVFQAISEFHPGPWQQWPVALRDRDPAALAAFAAAHGDAIEFHLYLQFLAERGLARAAQAGLAVGLLRDLAVGAAGDGAEIWANPGLYVSSASIGAPPDPLGPQGQIWALPPPNPHVAVQTGHKAFIELIQANMRHAGGLRIDHILGLRRLFWVPNGAKASEGAYVTMPMEQFFAELALESHRAQCLVIGEDLGTVAPGLREAMQDHAILRNRMLLLDYEHGAFPPAASYPVLCATAVSSHDLPTLAGWRQAADITERETLGLFDPTTAARERAARTDAIKALANAAHGDSPEAVHAFVASTPSLIATAQIEDLAGETVSVNLPGTDQERPNWRRRMAVGIEKIPTRVIEAMRKVRG